jgi:hypothetical protein
MLLSIYGSVPSRRLHLSYLILWQLSNPLVALASDVLVVSSVGQTTSINHLFKSGNGETTIAKLKSFLNLNHLLVGRYGLTDL